MLSLPPAQQEQEPQEGLGQRKWGPAVVVNEEEQSSGTVSGKTPPQIIVNGSASLFAKC